MFETCLFLDHVSDHISLHESEMMTAAPGWQLLFALNYTVWCGLILITCCVMLRPCASNTAYTVRILQWRITFWKSLELSQRDQWILGHVSFLQMARLSEESWDFQTSSIMMMEAPFALRNLQDRQRSLVVFWRSESATFFWPHGVSRWQVCVVPNLPQLVEGAETCQRWSRKMKELQSWRPRKHQTSVIFMLSCFCT